jgi:hypothetical protein
VTKIDDFSFGSANSRRHDACRRLTSRNPGKHRLFCNPERRGVEFIARVAAALDDDQQLSE